MNTLWPNAGRLSFALIASALVLTAYAAPGNQTRTPARTADNRMPSQSCSKCRSQPLQEPVYGYFPGGESDDYRIQWITVGTKHACAACGGKIESVDGRVTNRMRSNCPVCAKAAPSCCKLSG